MMDAFKVYLIRDDDGDEVVLCRVGMKTDIFDNRASLENRFNFAVRNIPREMWIYGAVLFKC